jgi:hypothetical protein
MGRRWAIAAACLLAACGGKVVHYLDHGSSGGGGASSSSGAPGPDPYEDDPGAPPPSTPAPAPPPVPDPTPACAVSFAGDVLPKLVAARCSLSACHGGHDPPNLPRIDPSDPIATWKELRAFRLSDGRVYVAVGAKDPNASGMRCNLRGECGARMPLGAPMPDADLSVVDAWLACGAPPN